MINILKFFFVGLVSGSTLLSSLLAQVSNATENLKTQANRMQSALLKGDYHTFAHYIRPMILGAMGGESKMARELTKSADDMKAKGMHVSRITFDAPSKLVKSGKEWQATMAQHTEIKGPNGRDVSTSTTIAVSEDNGVNWTFVDASDMPMDMIKKMLPNLSSALVIKPMQPAVHYNN